jgi:hypothetical protein
VRRPPNPGGGGIGRPVALVGGLLGGGGIGRPLELVGGRGPLGRTAAGRGPAGGASGVADAAIGRAVSGAGMVGFTVVGRSTLGRSTVGRSTLGRSTVGRSMLVRSTVGRSTLGRAAVGRGLGARGGALGRSMLGGALGGADAGALAAGRLGTLVAGRVGGRVSWGGALRVLLTRRGFGATLISSAGSGVPDVLCSRSGALVSISAPEVVGLAVGRAVLRTGALALLATFLTGTGSSGWTGRRSPSASALRRTRSALASSIDEEWLLTPIPSERARSSPSLLVSPSSRASS